MVSLNKATVLLCTMEETQCHTCCSTAYAGDKATEVLIPESDLEISTTRSQGAGEAPHVLLKHSTIMDSLLLASVRAECLCHTSTQQDLSESRLLFKTIGR